MKKLYIAIFAVTLVLFTFGVSAFAWLRISNINIVDGINLEAGSGDTLELSLDGITFNKRLDETKVKELLKDLKITDVTSLDGINFTRGMNYSNKTAIPNKDYISFDVWFRVIPEEGVNENEIFDQVFLVNKINASYDNRVGIKGTYVTSEGKLWQADYSFNNGDTFVNRGDIRRYYAKDAIRIGFSSESNTFIYDVSEDETRGYGETFGAFEYYNLKNGPNRLTKPEVIPNTKYQLSKISNAVGILLDDNSLITRLTKEDNGYYVGKAKLNIWLEGWDPDSIDAVLSDHLYMQLEFMAGRLLK